MSEKFSLEYPINFGKVTYEPGVPKNAPRWVWTCACDECKKLPEPVLHGPFKTLRAAERDVKSALQEAFDGWTGTHH